MAANGDLNFCFVNSILPNIARPHRDSGAFSIAHKTFRYEYDKRAPRTHSQSAPNEWGTPWKHQNPDSAGWQTQEHTHTDTKIHKVILTGAKESAQKSVLSRCCFILDSLSRLPHSSQPPPRYPSI